MPILANQRWEKFAQSIASGESGAAAYRKTYDAHGASAEANASRLLRNDKVKHRMAELQAQSATAAILTMQQRREIAREIALDTKARNSDRLAAIMADARLAGELKGDGVTVNSIAVASSCVMTEAVRAEIMAERRAALEDRSYAKGTNSCTGFNALNGPRLLQLGENNKGAIQTPLSETRPT